MGFGTRSCCKYDVCKFPIEGFSITDKTRKLKYYTNMQRKDGSKRALLCPNQSDEIDGVTFKGVGKTRKLKSMKDLDQWCNIKPSLIKKQPLTKIIWLLWLQGFDKAPEIVKKCVESWAKHNKGWKIVKLDENNLSSYVDISKHISKDQKATMSPNHYANVIRLLLLKIHGGFWVDATNYCVKPIDAWFHPYAKEGFFVFSRDGYGPDRVVGNWFIYAEKNNYLLDKWLEATLNFWKEKGDDKVYHWQPKLFFNLCKTDKIFRELWSKVPKFSAIGPYGPLAFNKGRFGGGIYKDIDANQIYNLKHKMAPFYKSTWKDHDKATQDSVINFFLNL